MRNEPNPKKASGKSSGATNPSVGYEPQDVNPGTIFKYLAALLLTVFASMLIVWGVYRALVTRTAREAADVSPLRPSAGRILPPEPRLQGAPGNPLPPQEELRRMRAEAEATLESHGWVDEKTGIARIPIERAMKLLVERGPSGTKAPAQQAPVAPEKAISEKHP